jgi:integrase
MASLKKRGNTYYAQYYVGGQQKRISLNTNSLQIAKEKIRQIESSQMRGTDLPLPTKTKISIVVASYVDYLYSVKTARNAQRDIYYLRQAFGPVCSQLELKNEKISQLGQKKLSRKMVQPILANYFEQITTTNVATFITAKVRSKDLSPKTANRFREILTRLFNWAMQNQDIRMPENINPAAKVERYKEKAPKISFLSKPQITEQLSAIDDPQLQTMVALYIYSGVRREEALWLTEDDIDLSQQQGMIRIRAKTIEGEYWQPKTGVNRAIPISKALRSYLEKYQRPKTDASWFFPSPQLKRWNPDNFSRKLRKTNVANNLSWGCLDFRHTFGSHLAMKGESLYKISKLMGNSPEICRRHYAAIIPEALIDTVEF